MDDWKLQPARDMGLSPARRATDLSRECGLMETISHALARATVRGYLRTAHRLRVVGREHLPTRPPFVLIANHSSHLDALTLAAPLSLKLCDQVFPVAAGDVFFKTPTASWASVAVLNALPMWRKNCGSHAMASLRSRLVDEPCGLILFPEGTRSRDGSMGPFKAGLGMIVAGTSVPVIPCRLEGAFAAWPPERKWPRPLMPLTLRIGPPLQFADQPDSRRGWEHIAQACEHAVRGLG